jgi:D-aminopeptidase
MATSMTGVNDNFVPALPLDEVRRFVDACRPIFASVKKRPQQTSAPVSRERPSDVDKEGDVKVSAGPAHRGARGRGHPFPYPTLARGLLFWGNFW